MFTCIAMSKEVHNSFVTGNNHVEQFGIEPGVDYINHGTDEQMVSLFTIILKFKILFINKLCSW